MNLRTADDRYKNDAKFRHLVKMLEAFIEQLELTPSEIREAAVFACMQVELRRPPRPIALSPELVSYIELNAGNLNLRNGPFSPSVSPLNGDEK